MSKRSNFEKIPKDFYASVDPKAIPPNLVKHLRGKTYAEPCYGEGDLEDRLMDVATCKWRSDIRSTVGSSKVMDGLELSEDHLYGVDCIVTNPPFSKGVLLPLLDHWRSLRPIWVLLPADYLHNKYMADLMQCCSNVVSVGRLYWFENTWETKVAFDYDQLDPKWDKSIEFYDSMKGIKYYSGWLTNDGKPCKTQFVRGTDNYIWACFRKHEMITVFETRGD